MILIPSLGHAEIPPVKSLPPQAILHWLHLGWQDIKRCGFPSIFHGIAVMAASWLILAFTLQYWPLAVGAISGFLLTGPVFATGLYGLSRHLERGEKPDFGVAVAAWIQGSHCLFRYVLLLLAVATAWVVFSVLMFKLFVTQPIDTPLDFLRYVVTQAETQFFLWTVLGGLGSALVFGLTVISIPVLIDRDVTLPHAMAISIQVVGKNPVTMVVWALVILMLTGLSFITGMLGFILLYPLMGHASWHVYRELVDTSSLPLREDATA